MTAGGLRAEGVVRRFGGVTALAGVDLLVPEGQVHALIGPNGSGKSTLINCISGVDAWDGGSIQFGGEDVSPRRPRRAAALGIARTFQTLRLFTHMSVLHNVLVPMHAARPYGLAAALSGWPTKASGERELRAAGRDLLELVGIAHLAERQAGALSYGQQRLVEIARALAVRPRLLLLDEPAAGLNDTETAALTGLVRQLRREDLSVLVVEHNMSFVMQVSDAVTVLDNGRRIAHGTPAQVRDDAEVLRAYLGSSRGQVNS